MKDEKASVSIRGTTPEIERRARALRAQMTGAEAALWEALRGKQVGGLRFRAQHPVGRFILDFYCASCRLVVEVDGDSHLERGERDAERSAVLESLGYSVIRFTNAEVEADLGSVLERIRVAADAAARARGIV